MTREYAAPGWLSGRMRALVLAVVALVAAGCTTAPRIPVNRLEELSVGRSTKTDVERLLGRRQGEGGVSFSVDTRPSKPQYEVWYYVDWEKKSVSNEVYVSLPRVLLVFFDADTYQGFTWFDLTGTPPASVRGILSSR